jgi:mono/diheme cytochrome c family protein
MASRRQWWNGCFAACLILASGVSLPASGEPPATSPAADAPAAIDFERQIRPLLVGRCGDCHGHDTQESHLRLDVKHRALKGGDFGPVIVAGKGGDSELIRRITSTDEKKQMPPDGDRLSAAEIAILQRWIDSGAVWPESDADRLAREGDRDPRLDHWAWQPVARPAVPPAPAADSPVRNDIDRFIQFKLAARKLAHAPEADRRTLSRRLSFDLLGLPPTPEDVAAFVADDSPDAYEKLVDRLLASPHYGERWARHWLDIAHYADTHGFERDQLRPNAWRYRDWVIKALNTDLPYDEFIRRQIAGDVVASDDADAVIATGFLVAGPWDFVGQSITPSRPSSPV